MNESKYVVYKIINNLNGKFYVGVHKTKKLQDSYFGSGIAIKNAIKKYGKQNFIKEILFIYDNEEEAYEKEKEIVNEDFVKRKDTYNKTLGGVGGFYHIPPKFGDDSPMRNPIIVEKARINLKETKRKNVEFFRKISIENLSKAKNSHTKEANEKRSKKMKAKNNKMSDEHKMKISDGARKYFDCPEKKEEFRESLRKSYTEERLKFWSERLLGEKNPNFCGYYTTPKGTYSSLILCSKDNNINCSTLMNRCKYHNMKIVTKFNINRSKDLNIQEHSHYIGRSWKDNGWYFTNINKN